MPRTPRRLAPRGLVVALLVLAGMALGVGGSSALRTGATGPGTGPAGDRHAARRPGSVDGPAGPATTGDAQAGLPGPEGGLDAPGRPAVAAQEAVATAWRAAARRDGTPEVPVVTRTLPVQLTIERLGISAAFERLGLNGDGTMQVPRDWAKVGWYAPGVTPGDPGRSAAIVAGHLDSDSGPAVFYRLREARPGDVVRVRRADSTTATFVVERVMRVAKRELEPAWLTNPDGRPALRLITCAGTFDRRAHTYQDNLIVFARWNAGHASAPR